MNQLSSAPSVNNHSRPPLTLDLNFLDRLAKFLLEKPDGKPQGFILQTLVEFIGIPTVLSGGDLLGLLRGYLNLRQGQILKGRLEIITSIVPWIPTGPVHFIIEKLLPSPTLTRNQPTPANIVK